MKPLAQARLLGDFCDFNSPVPNTWQSLIKNTAKKKTKMSREKLSGVPPNSFWRPRKELVYNITNLIYFFRGSSYNNETLTRK